MTDNLEARFESFTALIAGINHSINHSIRKLKTEVMAEFDLRSTHLYCLYYLYRDCELTPGELCELCSEDKAAISRSLKYLEERGCIGLIPSPVHLRRLSEEGIFLM